MHLTSQYRVANAARESKPFKRRPCALAAHRLTRHRVRLVEVQYRQRPCIARRNQTVAFAKTGRQKLLHPNARIPGANTRDILRGEAVLVHQPGCKGPISIEMRNTTHT